jgi:BirA family biotin operon repressor/biotin-[acetyl-CoA-carboxylase] ligase
LLRTRVYGRSLVVKDETGSTNDDAREAAERGVPRGHVVVADAQQKGRGARGRGWSSPPGTDLYVSIVERLDIPSEWLAAVTLAVGLGVAEAVEELVPGLAAQVKWPNDVWIGRRKVAGILVEASSLAGRVDALVIGIGLNVNRTEFEGELAETASSLLLEARRARPDVEPLGRERALAVVLERVERRVEDDATQGPSSVIAALEPRLALRGERVRCETLEGVLLGLAPTGGARIETEHGVCTAVAGTLRPL